MRAILGSCSLAWLLTALLAPASVAQQEAPPTLTLDWSHDTGWVENTSAQERVIISFEVSQFGSEWMRVYFEDVMLGGSPATRDGAILRMTSHLDGAVQELDSTQVRQWKNSSAYFNGDIVQVEVIAKPGIGARLVTSSLDVAMGAPTESICGSTDDRTLSNDPRSGRILPIGCTGWIIDDCAHCHLTAGHCSSGTDVLQFNVPTSNSNGTLNHPGPEDQYSVDPASLQSNGGQGVGNDYAYFGTFANSTTGLTAFEAQGAAFTLASPPSSTGGVSIRITGFGTDSSPSTSNQVQQTHVGPMAVSSGTQIGYVTDTTGGNSGSPVIWENTGAAIGIHTHGGCSSSGGNNWGTGSNHSGLQNYLNNPQGICACGPGGGPTVVHFDGFESGNFSAGGWTRANNNARVRTNASFSGTYGAHLKRSTWIERAIPTNGFSDVEISYARDTQGLESNEFLTVQVSTTPGVWTTLEATRTTNYSTITFDAGNGPAGMDDNSNLRIRFEIAANRNNEWARVDDVEVTGTSL